MLLSERAHRSVLSTAVLFLAGGFAIGRGGLGLLDSAVLDPLVEPFARWALIAILFTDGARLRLSEIAQAWHLPGRALLFGLPLTLGGIACAGHYLLGMTWIEALLVGAILSPTDPVFVSAILERESVPIRLRRLLSIESGLNDGLVLPIVVLLLRLGSTEELHVTQLLAEVALGIALGAAVAAGVLWLESRRVFAASLIYQPLAGVAVATVILGASSLLHANEFLASFTGGVTLATLRPRFAESFRTFGAPVAEILKLATLLVFGAALTFSFLSDTGWGGLVFALLALLAARPLALILALRRGGLSRQEWLAAAWFGPKGFASLLYALIMLHAGLPRGSWLFEAIALVIVLSIVAHSSTDVAVARSFHADTHPPAATRTQP